MPPTALSHLEVRPGDQFSETSGRLGPTNLLVPAETSLLLEHWAPYNSIPRDCQECQTPG